MNANTEKWIISGGPIITMNDNQPLVEAVGFQGELITSVGNLEVVKEIMGDKYIVIDLKGKTLLPGFIDSHIHVVGNLFYYFNLNLSNIKSLKEIQDLLKSTIKQKKKGEFILGLNLDEQKFFNPNERVLPTRWDLDQVSPDNPVFLLRHDVHLGIANTRALELAGIDINTEAPEGGTIQKKDGKITGILVENATNLMMSKYTLPDKEVLTNAASRAFKDLAKKGITSVHTLLEHDRKGGVEGLGGIAIPLLQSIEELILQNVYCLIYTARPKRLKKIKKPPLDSGNKYGKIKVGGLKSWFDGTFGSSSAYLFEPFADQSNNKGFLVIDEQELYERMKEAHNLGFQIAIHAIGDKANRILVDLYKKLLLESPREDHRHRIEHASILTPDVIKDMKDLGLIGSCQPAFINSEYDYLEKRIGKERCKYTYPYKSLIDAGIIIAGGSDCPVEDSSVIMGLHALVTRNGFVPEQCISIKDALKIYTINGAYASFEEDIKGSIEKGKLADFVILDKNPLETPIDEIKNIQVLETMIRGKTVFKKNIENH
ncbi:MAG: amidohydrolase [Candidatus Hermodarchaeota archaeon]